MCLIEVVLDVDVTDGPLHGEQEGRFFHGYYKSYCYLPLYIFCGHHLLCARLRTADEDAAQGVVEELERIVARIRARWLGVGIVVRGDSGFCRDELMQWCEAQEVEYVLGGGEECSVDEDDWRGAGRGEAAARGQWRGGVRFQVTVLRRGGRPETGRVEVLRFVAAQDAGRAIHPSYVESQIQGGVAQGIGWALNEEYIYDEDGRLSNPGFLDYRVPVASDVPMIEPIVVEVPNPNHPYGAKGVGEVSICPPMAATRLGDTRAEQTGRARCNQSSHDSFLSSVNGKAPIPRNDSDLPTRQRVPINTNTTRRPRVKTGSGCANTPAGSWPSHDRRRPLWRPSRDPPLQGA